MASLPDEPTTRTLRELTLSDLLAASDEADEAVVEAFLAAAIEVAGDFLALHGKEVTDLPTVVYDPWENGVSYDPYHERGEVLSVGGPRGLFRGGEQVLSSRGSLTHNSLLSILCKGLVHSYNQQLVDEHFERHARASTPSRIELYDRFGMLNPAVDEGFAQMFVLYLEGDIVDPSFRREYVEEWAGWYQRQEEFDVSLFRAVARTVGARVDEADGDPRERLVYALAVQEPLIRDGDVSVLEERPDALG